MQGDRIYVDVRKWPDAPHWHYQVFALGEDAHGRWFFLPARSVIQRRPETPRLHPGDTVKLLPRSGSWVASFNARPHGVEVYVDVAAGPARLADGCLRFVDVDLDVARDWEGVTQIWDADEMEEHRVSLGYPDALVNEAWDTARALEQAVAARREPFARDGAAWLEQARACAWPVDPSWLDGSGV